jgi:hypothetical protein
MTGRYHEMYGLPCGHCGHPAHHIEVYPNGVRTVHMDRWQRPCDAVSPAPSASARSVDVVIVSGGRAGG